MRQIGFAYRETTIHQWQAGNERGSGKILQSFRAFDSQLFTGIESFSNPSVPFQGQKIR